MRLYHLSEQPIYRRRAPQHHLPIIHTRPRKHVLTPIPIPPIDRLPTVSITNTSTRPISTIIREESPIKSRRVTNTRGRVEQNAKVLVVPPREESGTAARELASGTAVGRADAGAVICLGAGRVVDEAYAQAGD